MNQASTRNRRATVLIAYAGFVILGLPDGLLSVAWPSIRQMFNTPLDSLGVLLLWSSAGFMVTSFASGRILSRLSIDRALLAGSLIRSLGLLGYVLSPSWPLLLAAALLNGAGSGILDAAANTYFAGHLSPRHTNWLHACFGLGSTSGPLIVSGVLRLGYTWRGGFLVAGILQLLIALAYAGTRGWWAASAPQSRQATNQDMLSALRLPAVWLGILLFLIYTGVEATAGQWSFTLFAQARGTPADQARFWVSLYWGAFTAGRLLFGLIANRVSIIQLARLAMVGAAVGAALLWWNPSGLPGFWALALIGLALAPIFPLLIADTPNRVGRQLAPHAVGFQVSAAGLGFAILPWLVGASAERLGLEVIGPVLAGSALLMLLVNAAAARRQ